MKKILLLASLAATATFALAQVASYSSRLAWDAVTKDVEGNNETLARYEVAVSLPGVNLNSNGVPLGLTNVPGTQLNVEIAKLFPSNNILGTYRLHVRAIDTAGNTGEWSFIDYPLDFIKPAPVTNLNVNVQVRIGGK